MLENVFFYSLLALILVTTFSVLFFSVFSLDLMTLVLHVLGCGSGLSGETLTENGHQWIGLDISQSMLGMNFNLLMNRLWSISSCIIHFGKNDTCRCCFRA